MQQHVIDLAIRRGVKATALAVVGATQFSGATLAATDAALLPRNLSPWNMFVDRKSVV